MRKKVQIFMNWRKYPSHFWTLSVALLLTARNQLFTSKEEQTVTHVWVCKRHVTDKKQTSEVGKQIDLF